jgi:MoaA/NifB/PqqE/SkfB family radical SAM enzyme/SAM-dependent methyltransferase
MTTVLSTPRIPSAASRLTDSSSALFRPSTIRLDFDGVSVFVDSEGCNWFAGDEEVAWLWEQLDGVRTASDLTLLVSQRFGKPLGLSRQWVETALDEWHEKGLVSSSSLTMASVPRRHEVLDLVRLNELWVHTNNSCNLACAHCLTSSGPGADPGLPVEQLVGLLGRAHGLGVRRFYFTGGEPFLRPDIGTLIRHVTTELDSELIIITNATLLEGKRLKDILHGIPRERLKLQVSLDGTTPTTNDGIRGEGVFRRVRESVPRLVEGGFDVALTAVPARQNLRELEDLPTLAAEWGARSIHLMWPHRKGRILEDMPDAFPSVEALLHLSDAVLTRCQEIGVDFDNYGSILFRVNGQPGIRYDLSNAGWDSLFVDRDGRVFPSAVFSQETGWCAGDLLEDDLEKIWRDSDLMHRVRRLSQLDFKELNGDPWRWFLGGGDLEHAALASGADGPEDLREVDPYYPVYAHLARRSLERLAVAGKRAWSDVAGYPGPRIYHVMGDGALSCGTEGVMESGEGPVQTLHSSCVLSFDVDKPRLLVRAFYGEAAVEPQQSLCCPLDYAPPDVDHIPEEVVERFYGCGSPVSDAGIREGERVVDLGCGAGIDCFVAARRVGRTGRVVGVDMTDEMLDVARSNSPTVSQRLGFDVVEFRKGYLESIPVEDRWADLIVSNCVINLSPDKRQVFREMYRVLSDGGRIVVSDIVCESGVPPRLRVQEHLWGECISGALSEGEFVRGLAKAGFYGLTILKRFFWREVEGFPFYSVTVAGYRWPNARKTGRDHVAIYRGPFAEVSDDLGQTYRRGLPVPVDSVTAQRLRSRPYDGAFQVLQPGERPQDVSSCCPPGESCCAPGEGYSTISRHLIDSRENDPAETP